MNKPTILKLSGGIHNDARGSIHFLNDLEDFHTKRIYIIENAQKEKSRGWHGHKLECKLFYPISGDFKLALVKIDCFESPSKDLIPIVYFMSSSNPFAISVSGGYANNLISTSHRAKMMVLSNFTLAESQNDDFRYPENYWTT
jgi:dTDP-4-dehydrorhamnose 3,5-epimerase